MHYSYNLYIHSSCFSVVINNLLFIEKIAIRKTRRRRRWWTRRCSRKSSRPGCSMMRERIWRMAPSQTPILRMIDHPGVAPSDKSWPLWLPSLVPSTQAWYLVSPPLLCRSSRSQTALFPSRRDRRRNRGLVGH